MPEKLIRVSVMNKGLDDGRAIFGMTSHEQAPLRGSKVDIEEAISKTNHVSLTFGSNPNTVQRRRPWREVSRVPQRGSRRGGNHQTEAPSIRAVFVDKWPSDRREKDQ